ncbi:MAG: S8 family serine peptidase [Bacteroidota bacterium]
MKKTNNIQLFFVILFFSFFSIKNATAQQQEILVHFPISTPIDTIDAIRTEFNATELAISPISQIRLWRLDSLININNQYLFLIGGDTLDMQETGKKARAKVDVQSWEENYETEFPETQDPGEIIPCSKPITCPPSECRVRVAVIDSGVDTGHSYFSGFSFVSPYDFINNTTNQIDQNGHGTHVAGTIIQMANSVGASTVEIMPLKALDSVGQGTVFDVIRAIDHAIEAGANIINLSLGYQGPRVPISGTLPAPLELAINVAGQYQVLVVAAAGNQSMDLDIGTMTYYPAAFTCSNLISVAASGCRDQLMHFSNEGVISLDISAPGEVRSTILDNKWSIKSGTSMAAAVLTGSLALVSTNSCPFEAERLKTAMLNGADITTAPVETQGRVNAQGALAILGTLRTFTPNINPQTSDRLNADLDLQLSPVPFGNNLNIQWNQSETGLTSIFMSDATGRVVFTHQQMYDKGINNLETQHPNLVPGIYFITLKHQKQLITQKTIRY